MAGMSVMKMPANSLATSRIGPQVKPLPSRISLPVNCHDIQAMASSSTSRTTFCSSTVDAVQVKLTPGFQMPLISTATEDGEQQRDVEPADDAQAAVRRRVGLRRIVLVDAEQVRVEHEEHGEQDRRAQQHRLQQRAPSARRNRRP